MISHLQADPGPSNCFQTLVEQCSVHPGWLGYIEGCNTTQLYRDYKKPS